MKYVNATTILPDMLIEELQKYVQAGYVYIPGYSVAAEPPFRSNGYRESGTAYRQAFS